MAQKNRKRKNTPHRSGSAVRFLFRGVVLLAGIAAAVVFLPRLHKYLSEQIFSRYGERIIYSSITISVFVFFLMILIWITFLLSRRAYAGRITRKERAIGMYEIDGMNGAEFERYIGNLLEDLGYSDVTVTKTSGDQGVDVIASLGAVQYAIQCKRQVNDVGNKAVQEVSSGKLYYDCDLAVVVTNSFFTVSAIELAESNSVLLWDRDDLKEMMEDRMAGIRYRVNKYGEVVKSRR